MSHLSALSIQALYPQYRIHRGKCNPHMLYNELTSVCSFISSLWHHSPPPKSSGQNSHPKAKKLQPTLKVLFLVGSMWMGLAFWHCVSEVVLGWTNDGKEIFRFCLKLDVNEMLWRWAWWQGNPTTRSPGFRSQPATYMDLSILICKMGVIAVLAMVRLCLCFLTSKIEWRVMLSQKVDSFHVELWAVPTESVLPCSCNYYHRDAICSVCSVCFHFIGKPDYRFCFLSLSYECLLFSCVPICSPSVCGVRAVSWSLCQECIPSTSTCVHHLQ